MATTLPSATPPLSNPVRGPVYRARRPGHRGLNAVLVVAIVSIAAARRVWGRLSAPAGR